MAVTPSICNFGWKAEDFSLPATDGKAYTLSDIAGERGALLMFICNHCPYVVAIADRMVRDAKALQAEGIGVAAICSNDAVSYPDDSFENMGKFAAHYGFTFPYLHDESQTVAKAYGAVCTPDFFGFNADLGLQYRGRLDGSKRVSGPEDLKRDLFDAMRLIADTGEGPREQVSSMGCSIKWRAA